MAAASAAGAACPDARRRTWPAVLPVNRPLVWAAAAVAVGIAAGARLAPVFLALFLGALLLGVAFFFLRGRAGRDRAFLLGVFAIAGLALGIARAQPAQLDTLAMFAREHAGWGAVWTIEGTVSAGWIYREGQYGRLLLDVDTLSTPEGPRGLPGRVSVRCSEPAEGIHSGTRLRVRGRIDPTLSQVNFGISSVEDHLRARGVHLGITAKAREITVLGVDRFSPGYWAGRFRQAEADLLARHVPRAALPFVLAVWLGEGAALSREEYDAFVISGTAHVLSVSGVHVAIVYMTLSVALSGLVRGRRARALLIISGVFLYAVLAGAHVATLRSALMFALYIGADLVDREPDAPTSLGLAALLFLIARPLYVFDAGFLLSFTSVASMLLFNDAIADRLPGGLGPLRAPIATTVSAQLLPFPLVAHYFHIFSTYGILANLIVVPLLTAVLWLCVLTTLTAPLLPPAATLFGHATAFMVEVVRWLVQRTADLPGSLALISSPAWYSVPFAWISALLAAHALRADESTPRHEIRVRWAAAGLCLALTALLWRPWGGGATVEMFDVGHGDAMFVRTPGGTTFLIDGGDRDEYRDSGRNVVVPCLLAQGVRRLDYVVCTHPDRDHIGGLFAVLERLRVGKVLLGGPPTGAPLESALLRLCVERGVPVERFVRGQIVPARGATIELRHPGPRPPGSGKVNDQSIVLRIAWPGFSMLCTGDIEAPAEEEVIRFGGLAAEVLKVPHHGSNTSSTGALLDAVRPRIALCSTDARVNRRPVHPEVASRYEARGIPLLRTDYSGGLRIVFREVGWHIESARAVRGYTLAPFRR